MCNTAIEENSDNVQRFFEAMNYVLREKNDIVQSAIDGLTRKKTFDRVSIPLSVRYTLRDGKIWEPYHDKKSDKHGWRLLRSRSILDWFYRQKHGHDKDFVEELPTGPVRQPAYFLEELWSWDTSIDSANHYLMARQEYMQFHTFILLAHMLRSHLEQRTMRYENYSTFTKSLAYNIGDAAWGVDWNSVRRFHAEVMEAMKTVP